MRRAAQQTCEIKKEFIRCFKSDKWRPEGNICGCKMRKATRRKYFRLEACCEGLLSTLLRYVAASFARVCFLYKLLLSDNQRKTIHCFMEPPTRMNGASTFSRL